MGFVGRVTNSNFYEQLLFCLIKHILYTRSLYYLYLHLASQRWRNLMVETIQDVKNWNVKRSRFSIFLCFWVKRFKEQSLDGTLVVPKEIRHSASKEENSKCNTKSVFVQEQTAAIEQVSSENPRDESYSSWGFSLSSTDDFLHRSERLLS